MLQPAGRECGKPAAVSRHADKANMFINGVFVLAPCPSLSARMHFVGVFENGRHVLLVSVQFARRSYISCDLGDMYRW